MKRIPATFQVIDLVTPLKINMSPKKRTISIGNASSNHHFSGDMLVFRGVNGIVMAKSYFINLNFPEVAGDFSLPKSCLNLGAQNSCDVAVIRPNYVSGALLIS